MRGRNEWERNDDRTNKRDGETARQKGGNEIMI
jgi:hypothetical protein